MRKTFVVMLRYMRVANVEVAVIFWLLGNEAFETALKNVFFLVAVLIFSLMIPFLLHIRYPFSSLGRVGVISQNSRPANESFYSTEVNL